MHEVIATLIHVGSSTNGHFQAFLRDVDRQCWWVMTANRCIVLGGSLPSAVSCFAIRAHLQHLTRLQDTEATEGTTQDCSKLGSELEIAASALDERPVHLETSSAQGTSTLDIPLTTAR